MDKIIEELVQMENRADAHLAEVYEEKKKLPQKIQTKAIEIQEAIEKDTKQQVRKMIASAYDESDARIRTVVKLSQEQFSVLEQTYQANSQQWQNQIFNKILGR